MLIFITGIVLIYIPLSCNTSVKLGNPSVKLVTEGFFLNNEKHKTTRKNFMEAALTASMRRTLHEIFSGHFVFFVVKKYHRHPVSLTHYPFHLRV